MSGPVTSFDESTLATFPATLELLEEQGILTPTVTLDRLGPFLSAAQRAVVEQVMDLDPRDYGVHTPYAGDLEPVPADLVKVAGQQYSEHGEQQNGHICYCPHPRLSNSCSCATTPARPRQSSYAPIRGSSVSVIRPVRQRPAEMASRR